MTGLETLVTGQIINTRRILQTKDRNLNELKPILHVCRCHCWGLVRLVGWGGVELVGCGGSVLEIRLTHA